MTFQSIRHAQQRVWPAVQKSLVLVRAQRDAVRNDRHPSKSAEARAKIPWNRVVANETVWALAKDDMLATEEQAAVVAAARAWVTTWEEDGLSSMDEQERALYDAVQALAGSLRDMSDVG